MRGNWKACIRPEILFGAATNFSHFCALAASECRRLIIVVAETPP
jgi:hypothetical protein